MADWKTPACLQAVSKDRRPSWTAGLHCSRSPPPFPGHQASRSRRSRGRAAGSTPGPPRPPGG
eukprot:14697061-Alexandrium_andersonii.AAC.1